jgi:hypothetical protein
MAINSTFIALSIFAGLTLLLVLLLVSRVRPWHYPVRYVNFDYGVRERAAELASRGPSGGEAEEFETEESKEPEGWWERVKRGLYTYPKRPS